MSKTTPPTCRIITYGLSAAQNALITKNLPVKNCALLDTDTPTDLIALDASSVVINIDALKEEDLEILLDYYSQINGCTDESVFWLSKTKPPKHLRTFFKWYETFDDFAAQLKYHLLNAYNKCKKARDFSKKMAACLLILSKIRNQPYIKTQQLADMLELPLRTIQRYIATLQATGEWIDYDTRHKGWYLQDNISLLFGDI